MLPHQLLAIDVVAVAPRVRRRRTYYCRAGAVGMRIRFVTGWNLFSCALRLAIISHGFGIEVWNNVSESLQIIRLTYLDGGLVFAYIITRPTVSGRKFVSINHELTWSNFHPGAGTFHL